MNNSTNSGSSANICSASALRRRRRWWLWAAAVLCVVLLVLRETGLLSLRLASLQTHHQCVTTTGTSQSGDKEEGEFEDLMLKAELGLNPHPGVTAAAAEQLRGMVFGQGRSNGVVRITFKEGELTGPYWLPLFKKGHCHSRAECEWNVRRGRNVSTAKISVETDVDARAIGFMSVREFKAQFSDAIAERIAQVLRDKLEKK